MAVVGFPERAEDVYNSAAVLADGEVTAVYRKMYLPNYGVFDEQRYFQSGAEAAIVEINGIPGVSICEDIWEPGPPAMTEALGGAQVIVNLSASPTAPDTARTRMLVQRAVDYLAAVVFVNTVGGQDELVFDGHSLAIDQDGTVLTAAPSSRRSSASPPSTPARWSPAACATPVIAPTCAASAAPPRWRSRPCSRWPA